MAETIKYSSSNIRWIQATFLGWLLSTVIIIVLAMGFDALGIGNLQFFMGAGLGAGIGFMQWRALKKNINASRNWIWYSMIGLGTPFLVFDLLKIFAGISLGDYYLLTSACLAGLFSGVLQCMVLKVHSPKAAWWIPGNFIGWVLATLTFWSINYTNALPKNNWLIFFVNLALILAGGVILGAVTKFFLVRILPSTALPKQSA